MSFPEHDREQCRQTFKPSFVARDTMLEVAGKIHTHHNFIVSGFMRKFHINDNGEEVTVGASFDYWFLDESFNTLYQSEQRFQRIFFSFSVLHRSFDRRGFWMVALTIRQRIKELGIRKIVGAGFTHLLSLIAADFALLIVVAIVIATPIAWYYMNIWLQDVDYRIHLSAWMFAASGMTIFIVTMAIIIVQTVRAFVIKPVRLLRIE